MHESKKYFWKQWGKRTLIVMMVGLLAIPVYATSTKDQIDDVNQQKEDAQSRIAEMEYRIAQLAEYKQDALAYIEAMDRELLAVQEYLEDLGEQKIRKEEDIEDTGRKLEDAKAVEAEQNASMRLRIQFMYENGNISYMEMFLGAESLSDLLNKAEYVSQITAYDRRMLLEYQNARAEVEAKEAQLKKEKEELEGLIVQTEAEERSYQMLIEEKSRTIAQYDEEMAAGAEEIAAMQAELAAFDEQLKALEERLRQESAKFIYDGGQFYFPVEWYYRVSSPFGWRIHPIYNSSILHNGIDLSADTGTEIYAAYQGEVVISEYSSTAGNYIMINHGSGLYTVYMHCSKLLVSEGDIVSKGQRIGLVGTTGNSTGPHLHFGVRENGEYVDPAPYIGLN